MEDIKNKCVECLEDTSFGSGKFVNRIPASNEEYEGYLCPDCRAVDCDICKELVLDEYEIIEGRLYCTLNEKCLEVGNIQKDIITRKEIHSLFENSSKFKLAYPNNNLQQKLSLRSSFHYVREFEEFDEFIERNFDFIANCDTCKENTMFINRNWRQGDK